MIEKNFGCKGGGPYTPDYCRDEVGPSFEIEKIIPTNKFIVVY
jgi:hypothetical protein